MSSSSRENSSDYGRLDEVTSGDRRRSQPESDSRKIRCPTCNGVGSVRKEEQGQLVALIPLKDRRLKPRRTVIYVSLAVLLCLIVGGLTCFFLYPRNVNLYSNQPVLQPNKVNFTNTTVKFHVPYGFNLSNSNFYSIPLKAVNISASIDKQEVAKTRWIENSNNSFTIPSKSHMLFKQNFTFNFNPGNAPNYVDVCKDKRPWVHNFYAYFTVTVLYSAMNHDSQISQSFFQRVICNVKSPPETSFQDPEYESITLGPDLVMEI